MPGIAGIQLGISILGISMLGISILGISILGISGMPGIPLPLPSRWWQWRASGNSKQHQQSLAHTLINLAPSREPTPPHCQRGRHTHPSDDRGRVENVPHRRAVCSSARPHRGRTWAPSRKGILVLCSVHKETFCSPALCPLPEVLCQRGVQRAACIRPGACTFAGGGSTCGRGTHPVSALASAVASPLTPSGADIVLLRQYSSEVSRFGTTLHYYRPLEMLHPMSNSPCP
jgi:hypothetical protein